YSLTRSLGLPFWALLIALNESSYRQQPSPCSCSIERIETAWVSKITTSSLRLAWAKGSDRPTQRDRLASTCYPRARSFGRRRKSHSLSIRQWGLPEGYCSRRSGGRHLCSCCR